jgi:hypothetical protein
MTSESQEKYYEKLKDKRWLDKRKEIMHRDGYRCATCGRKKKLQVHHIFYVNGKLPWEYPEYALITLCSDCHKKWHEDHGVLVKKGFRDELRASGGAKATKRKKPLIKKRKHRGRRRLPHPDNKSLAANQSKEIRYRRKVNGEWVIVDHQNTE